MRNSDIISDYLFKQKGLSLQNKSSIFVSETNQKITTYYDLFQKESNNNNIINILFGPTLFMILHGIFCLNHFGILHNDLHLNNILIDEYVENPISEMSFYYEEKNILIHLQNVHFIPKIFDFDHSIVYNKSLIYLKIKNYKQEIPDYGINETNKRFFNPDLYKVFKNLSFLLKQKLALLFEDIIQKQKLQTEEDITIHMVKKYANSFQKTIFFYSKLIENILNEIMTTISLDEFFNNYIFKENQFLFPNIKIIKEKKEMNNILKKNINIFKAPK